MRTPKATITAILRVFALLTAILSVLGASGDQARFNNLGNQMICMCGCNQILLQCNHVGCTYSDKMRGELMAAVERGGTDNAIQQSFILEYGLTVLAAPANSGFGRVAWITPFAVFITGTLLAVLVIRNWRFRSGKLEAGRAQPASDLMLDYKARARKETEL